MHLPMRKWRKCVNKWRLIKNINKVVRFLLLFLVVVIVTFPLFWMLSTSFKQASEVTQTPQTLLPINWTFKHYTDLFKLTKFEIYFKNSVIVATAVTTLSIVVATLSGYALARRKNQWWMKMISRTVLMSYVFPQILLVIPIFIFIRNLGLGDTLAGLIITHITFVLPFSMMLLKSYFESIPLGFEEAAYIDGASLWQTFVHVALPMALPGVVSTAIFGFIEGWNEFLFALVLITTDAKRTLPVGINTFLGRQAIYSWGMLMAAAVLTTIPALIFFFLIQRNLVAGFWGGGMKG
jgi:ABC-type glycerol-3-phosphate transport system permease component